MAAAGSRTSRALVAAALALGVVGVIGVAGAGEGPSDGASSSATGAAAGADCSGAHWVTTWLTAPQDRFGPFEDQTIRSIVTTTAGGTAVRVTLSNRFGDAPVTFDDVHVAERLGGASVHPETVRPVTFDGGAGSVSVPAGQEVVSDPVELAVDPGVDLAVSYHVPGPAALDRHLQAIQTSYVTDPGAGRHGADVVGSAFTREVSSWFGLVAVDVMAPLATGAVAVLGDSITEGVGSTPDQGRRWTDLVARELDGTAVLNAGIGGNHAARAMRIPSATTGTGWADFGPAAKDRLAADVLSRSGVTDLVVFVGINDVFTRQSDDVPGDVTAAFEAIVAQGRAAGLRVIGATITPGSQGGPNEADRTAINEWIRTSGAFDAVVDFDRATADPADPSRLRAEFDTDRVHLTDAGYAALAAAFDESVLQGAPCAA